MQTKDPEINFLNELKQICQAPYTLTVGIFRLVCLEMQLARKSLALMVCLFFLLLVVGGTVWLTFNMLLVIGLMSFGFFLISALLVAIAFNILLCTVFVMFLLKYSKGITFSATRKQLISFQ